MIVYMLLASGAAWHFKSDVSFPLLLCSFSYLDNLLSAQVWDFYLDRGTWQNWWRRNWIHYTLWVRKKLDKEHFLF